MKSLRRTASFLLAAAFSFGLSAGAQAQQKPEGITIGYLNLVNAQLVTKALGLHEKSGVPIKWVKFGSGGDMNRAVAANQVDFGGVGNPPFTIGATRALPYKGIFVLNMLGPVESLAVRSDKNIKSLKDLAGKTAAAPFGSTTHYLFIAALKEAGVNPTDVKLIDLSPSDAVAAWLRKDIDAAWIWEPNLDKIVKNGGEIFLTSGEMAKRGYPTWDVGVVMNDFAAKYPEQVVAYVKAECEGIDYWLKHPKETVDIIAKELSLPPEDAERMMKGTTMVPCPEQITKDYLGTPGQIGQFADTVLATATFLKDQGRLPSVMDRAGYAAFIDPSFLAKALGK
ncbi:taurine transport system substrate-binding protein [Xanthobacter sp. SG618]|uniref:taurine ABC transporter substrate-binding protein n=1 Tax=Xanthobacter sp. SG618 TaxID=2587121 RepID=UPI00145E5AE5|nr:aliphatic sulfonate ABC transporter substrate-binding protein [Xanthobacter sp. SG618]NMN58913.1 taurine transport system substrate-binding protein [Xanthobacter sp. SG618]